MKTSITPNPKSFQPITLSITFESEDELMAFGAVFNMSEITNNVNIPTNEFWRVADKNNSSRLTEETNKLRNKLKAKLA